VASPPKKPNRKGGTPKNTTVFVGVRWPTTFRRRDTATGRFTGRIRGTLQSGVTTGGPAPRGAHGGWVRGICSGGPATAPRIPGGGFGGAPYFLDPAGPPGPGGGGFPSLFPPPSREAGSRFDPGGTDPDPPPGTTEKPAGGKNRGFMEAQGAAGVFAPNGGRPAGETGCVFPPGPGKNGGWAAGARGGA